MKKSVVSESNSEISKHLKSWYNYATKEQIKEGIEWYNDAQDFCKYLSKKYNISVYVVATVVSCLSPNNRWARNKLDAENLILYFLKGRKLEDLKVCTYNANKDKAWRAMQGEIISEKAPKTHAFAMNVGLLSSEHITIDKWHLRACLIEPADGIVNCTESCTIVQYRRIEQITAQIAKENNLKGYELQAIIWVTIKQKWNR
tara:strand:- start:52 stop:657 length:606 start_codon:yes stop_codon:yes gene_type:complete